MRAKPMTRLELLSEVKNTNPDLWAFLSSLTEEEWKDPDLCVVGDEPDGTVSYFWPSRVIDAA
jgi:hypothetical protein